jgi:hypothetical protein
MRLTLLFFLIQIYTSFISSAQNCLPEGILFTSQNEIDMFPSNYPGCHKIDGFLQIGGDDITNLDSLIALDSIQNELIFSYSPLLESLEGLNNLKHIGSLFIETSSIRKF